MSPGPGPGSSDSAALQLVTGALSAPVFVTAPPGDASRLFVVEQGGRIRVLAHDTLLPDPFLDVSGHIVAGGEQGLLSLAFHPAYAQNGRFYVYFTDRDGHTRVVRYLVSADPDVADSTSGDTILAVPQPFSNHNGGLLLFGPDGKLYVGLGDGGSGGDPLGNAQSLGTVLGKILRLDVDVPAPYVPADNPFVGTAGARGEIWLYGLRNPWRFSFDRMTGDLYVGDVGQNAWEEVDVLASGGSPGGQNLGWNVMEGNHCYAASSCNRTGVVPPVVEYGHGEGCSITGGHVFRNSRVTPLRGHYLYGDYCGGWVRSFRYVGGQATEPRDWPGLAVSGGLSSFGEDPKGDIYLTSLSGSLYRIVARP